MLNIKRIFFSLILVCCLSIGFQVCAQGNKLILVYPKNNQTIFADSTFFVGNTNPNAIMTINGNPVKVYSNGAFVRVFDLKRGKNIITLKSVYKNDVKTKTIVLNYPPPANTTHKTTPKQTLKPLNTTLVVADDEVPLRKTPYGDRLTPAKKGVVFKTIGLINKHYKIALGENRYGYIIQSATKPNLYKKLPSQQLKKIYFNEDAKDIIIKIPLAQPTITEIDATANALSIRLHNTKMEFENYLIKSPYIKDFAFSNDTFSFTLRERNLNGYDYSYDSNNFVLKVRKPFSKGLRGKIIAIDPGHGGKEAGAIGPTEIPEKNINLGISLYLKKELEKSGAKVIMTRSTDEFVKLYDRIDIANEGNADILVSIHNNSLPDGQNPYIVHGTSTYYYQPQALDLAKSVQKRLLEKTGFENHGIKHGSLALVRPCYPVSILIEVGFMINPFEYTSLLKETNQKAYATGIKNGIEDYFNQLYK